MFLRGEKPYILYLTNTVLSIDFFQYVTFYKIIEYYGIFTIKNAAIYSLKEAQSALFYPFDEI